jgi:hypothetical protein
MDITGTEPGQTPSAEMAPVITVCANHGGRAAAKVGSGLVVTLPTAPSPTAPADP